MFDTIDAVVPDALAIVAALVTQLGDVWFVAVLLAVLYWWVDDDIANRNAVAATIGLTIGVLALGYGLKELFAFPRPPSRLVRVEQLPAVVRPLYVATGTATGYGFPSGHALVSTVVYGLLAQHLTIRTRRWRYGVAAALVTIVCLTRIVLGVHFVVDVVVGAALGIAYVLTTGAAFSRIDDDATAAFGLAVGVSALALAAVGITPESVLLVGTSAVGLAWRMALRRRSGAQASAAS